MPMSANSVLVFVFCGVFLLINGPYFPLHAW